MSISSTNPATGETLQTFSEYSSTEVEAKLAQAAQTFSSWRHTSFFERSKLMLSLAKVLREKKEELGKIMTLEMGKPITQSLAEIEKCAWCAEYFAENAESFLAPEKVATDASESFVAFEPLGVVLAVMPWNFPFWQVIRFIAPAAMVGNVGVLKHASNVPQCALALEKLFLDAGFPVGVFQTLLIGSKAVEQVIADPRIVAVTLTGSEQAGSQVALQAGRELKKTVLELGGSNPFLILADADLELAVSQAVVGRFQNGGQSCIAAKRFIVDQKIADQFLEKFVAATEKMIVGDPLDPATEMGSLYHAKAVEQVDEQVQKSVALGAKLLTGGKKSARVGAFYEPTILTNVKKGMPVYDEETFGPVAAVIIVQDVEEAVTVANDTPFGLGASVFTQDLELARKILPRLDASCVFVNGIVKSDPRLPFGGVKKSGYGRELSAYGLREFMNVKTVWIR